MTLGELVSCLQDLTEDDHLVVAALAHFMAQGRIKTRAAKKTASRPAARAARI